MKIKLNILGSLLLVRSSQQEVQTEAPRRSRRFECCVYLVRYLPVNTHLRGRITVQLASSLTGLDLTRQENLLLFTCSEIKFETSHSVILPPMVSVLCIAFYLCEALTIYLRQVSSCIFLTTITYTVLLGRVKISLLAVEIIFW